MNSPKVQQAAKEVFEELKKLSPEEFRKELDKFMPPEDQPQKNPFNCSFCGASERAAKIIITGPLVNICDDCTDRCTELVQEHRALPFKDLREAP